MAYQVNKFNGTFLVAVEDGTIDTTTDLRFVGKNYAGYGEVQNENYLHLLESFANTTAPPKAIMGQIWYDSANSKLKFYTGSKFKVANGAEVSSTAPSGLSTGEFWWDSVAKQLYTWSGTDYVLVGPAASPDLGASSVTAQVVKDSLNNNHTIIKMVSAGTVVAIVSQDEFTLNPTTNPIQDFSLIKKGITLVKTPSSGVTGDDHYFWGTASNALTLNGFSAASFLKKDDLRFSSKISFTDDGLTVGANNDLLIAKELTDGLVLASQLGGPITIRITSGGVKNKIATFDFTSITPGDDGAYDIGLVTAKWRNIYANNFYGSLTGNLTGNSVGTHNGDIIADDTTVLINSTTGQIGYDGATLRGNLFGSVQGDLTGNADNASKLTGIAPSVTVPSAVNKISIPVRDATGNIAATKFIGITDKADRIKIDDSATDTDATYRTAKTTATANSIAARDPSGDLYATLFQGTATAARYADLAEKYLADQEYEVGTVVMVGGEKEVTASHEGVRAVGVVSANPAFMMNKDLEGGTYIALKGRVPVKVSGAVKKGDHLVASDNGCAVARHVDLYTFAIALESSDDTGLKLIEAVIL
jgi:hypothetical protein